MDGIAANDPLGDSASFNAIAWINELLERPGRGGDADDVDEALLSDVRAASTRLQVASQELSRDVNRFMDRLLTALPRADQELDRLDRDASQLKHDLKSLQNQAKAQDATPFKTLSDLDLIKGNLEKCIQILQEAGNWSSVVREMESYFQTRQLSQVASRLAQMRQSLKLLADLPEAQSRIEVVERMEQRLELLVRPGLKDALVKAANGSLDQLIDSVVVFSNLGRMDTLLRDFAQARGALVSRPLWETVPNDADDFVKWLPRFYEGVLRQLRDVEAPVCAKAFNDDAEAFTALVAVTADALSVVTDELAERIQLSEGAKASVAALERLVVVFATVDRFGSGLVQFLHQVYADGDVAPATRALSAPLVQLLHGHQALETRALASELEALLDTPSADEGDFLAPTVKEQLVDRIKAKDVLEQLAEDCARRSAQLHGRRPTVSVAAMFKGHAERAQALVETHSPRDDVRLELDMLKAVALLADRLELAAVTCTRVRALPQCDWITWPEPHTPDVAAFEPARLALVKAAAAARESLFAALMSPALALLDKAVANVEGDEVTRAVDYMYSLIPLLELESVPEASGPLFMADPHELGSAERERLVALVGGEVPIDGGNFDEAETWAHRITASWLETVARAMATGFVLRVLERKQVLDRKAAAKLCVDADLVEKNVASLLVSGSRWDPMLGATRAALGGVPFDAHAKYAGDGKGVEVFAALERMIGLKKSGL